MLGAPDVFEKEGGRTARANDIRQQIAAFSLAPRSPRTVCASERPSHAALGFALMPPTEPELRMLHRWRGCSRGVGDVVPQTFRPWRISPKSHCSVRANGLGRKHCKRSAHGTRPNDTDGYSYGQTNGARELNRKLTNPVSTIWSLSNQFNNFKLENGRWNNNWNFQPVLPISLNKDWNLITRPVMPFYNIVPHETAPGQFERTAGLGDLILLELLSPAHSGHWVLGAGPTFIFPTATSKFTGQGKWQAGPSVVAGYLTKEFFLGVFPQQWFSIGGDPDRPDTSQLNLQRPYGPRIRARSWTCRCRSLRLSRSSSRGSCSSDR